MENPDFSGFYIRCVTHVVNMSVQTFDSACFMVQSISCGTVHILGSQPIPELLIRKDVDPRDIRRTHPRTHQR